MKISCSNPKCLKIYCVKGKYDPKKFQCINCDFKAGFVIKAVKHSALFAIPDSNYPIYDFDPPPQSKKNISSIMPGHLGVSRPQLLNDSKIPLPANRAAGWGWCPQNDLELTEKNLPRRPQLPISHVPVSLGDTWYPTDSLFPTRLPLQRRLPPEAFLPKPVPIWLGKTPWTLPTESDFKNDEE